MRSLSAGIAVLLGACAASPSAVPLGGNEWVQPERHVDRRARGALTLERPSPMASVPAAAARPSTRASTPAAASDVQASTVEGPVRFDFKPLATGNVVIVETRFSLKAEFSTSFQGVTSSQEADVEAEERMQVRVVEASAEQVRVLDVEYLSSTFSLRIPGMDDEVESESGKRYRVTFQGGSPKVSAASGTLEAEEESQVLFDLATVTGYVPLVRAHLPATVELGWQRSIPGSDIYPMFGSLSSVRLEDATLSLIGRDATPVDRARFRCRIAVDLERDGLSLGANLAGTCAVRPSDARPLEVDLRGDLRASSTASLAADSNVTGTAEFHLRHEYR